MAAGLPFAVDVAAGSAEISSSERSPAGWLASWATDFREDYARWGYWKAARIAQRLSGLPEGRHASGIGGLRAWAGALVESGQRLSDDSELESEWGLASPWDVLSGANRYMGGAGTSAALGAESVAGAVGIGSIESGSDSDSGSDFGSGLYRG